MKSNTYKQAKEELKQLAADIKVHKPGFRSAQSKRDKLYRQSGMADMSWYERWTKTKSIQEFKDLDTLVSSHASPLHLAQYEFRHKHIAYCLLRGTPIEKIETLPKNPTERTNPPNMKYVENLLTSLKAKIAEEEALNVKVG